MVRKQWIGIVCLSLIIFTSAVSEAPGFNAPTDIPELDMPDPDGQDLDGPVAPTAEEGPAPDLLIRKRKVRKGDTASSLLNAYLPMKTIYGLVRRSAGIFPLSRIKAGQTCTFILDRDTLFGFEYEIDETDRLVIRRTDKGFSIARIPIDYEVRSRVISATIRSSLFEAVGACGEKSRLAVKLAEIFTWDIDFIRDIRANDQFRVIVEKRYKDNKFKGYGDIRAAVFINQGRRYTAILHRDENGRLKYYDEKGNSLQKAFLKAPLAFSRISSKFNLKRMHPILKELRAHPGIDYAAPTGTPIKTVGDGVVAGMGYSQNMGNHVIVRHSMGYVTRYYHMSRFADGLKKNQRIVQGQVIGYVGMTGLATGPHLCFRMKKNGRPVNPLTHASPSATPVAPLDMDRFTAKTRALLQQMYMARAEQQNASA